MSVRSRQLLSDHIREGDLAAVQALVSESFPDGAWCQELHARSGDGVLHVACRYGQLAVLSWFVDKQHAALEATNRDGKTALHEAAHSGQTTCVRFLLDRGAAVDCLKRADWTPLMLACTKIGSCHGDVVRMLVSAGADLRLTNKDGWTCFHIACREGDLDIVSYLLDRDPDLWDVASKNQRTPLHTAALHGQLSVVELLLSRGRYPSDVTDSCGTTPLMDAARGGHTTTAELLLSSGQADPLREDVMGRSCLHLAAQAGCTASITYLVRDKSVDVNIVSSLSGIRPVHLAAKEGHAETISLLCDLGADVNASDNKGRTALHQACGSKHVDCVRVLLKYGAHDTVNSLDQRARDVTRCQEIIDLLTDTGTT